MNNVSKFTLLDLSQVEWLKVIRIIKNSTSIIDYIFRLLGFEYLDRSDLVHIKPTASEVEAKAKIIEQKRHKPL